MARTFRQELETSLFKIAAMSEDIRKADFSKWPRFPSGGLKYHQLRDDPSYVAVRDINGMLTLVLANLEMVLSNASHDTDPAKAFERFSDSLTGVTKRDGYFTKNALSDGVLDTAVDVGLVTEPEAEILRAQLPWNGNFTLAQGADRVAELEKAIRIICQRIDTKCLTLPHE